MDKLEILKILVDPRLDNPGDRGVMKTVNSIAFSPDSQELASGSDDGLILLWSITSGTCEWLETTSSEAPIVSLAYSPSGSMLAYGSDALEGVEIQNLQKRAKSPIKLEVDGRAPAISYHSSGEYLAVGSDSLEILNIKERECVTRYQSAFVLCIIFSPDGKILASGNDNQEIDLWDVHFSPADGEPDNVDDPTRTLKGHTDIVRSVAFSPDNALIASGSDDGTARVWDVAAGTLLQTFEVGGEVNAVAFSPDGKYIVTAGSSVALWDVKTGQNAYEGAVHAGAVNAVAFLPEGRIIASGGNDAKIILWKAP